MKSRLQKEIKSLSILLLIGIAYLIFVSKTSIGIPCIFHMLTGLNCPACGITRMIAAVARLDFSAAYSYNPVLFVTLPAVIGCLIHERVVYIKYGCSKMHPLCKLFLWSEIIILIIYGIIRNIG